MRVSLQTLALLSIRIIDVNDNQPTISILFLTESGKPKVPENAKIRNRGEQQIYIIVFEVNVNLITIEIRVILINGHRCAAL